MESRDDDETKRPAKRHAANGWLLFVLRWGIAIVGVYWVVANISLHDRILVADPRDGWPMSVPVTDDPAQRTNLMARTDRQKVTVREDGREKLYAVLALKVTSDPDRSHWPIAVAPPRNVWQRYWNIHNAPARTISPAQVIGPWSVDVPYPLTERGLLPMLRGANPLYLWLAVAIYPITLIITALRWYELLKIVGIRMGAGKAFVVTMVGAFYNTFMPGSTGGDVLKAWYAAKLAPDKRTRAVVSVIVDRAVGLLALIILGGAMAGYLAWSARHGAAAAQANELVAQKCLQVALGAVAILVATAVGLTVFAVPALRRATGLDFVLRRLPWQNRVTKAIEALELYLRRPMTLLGMLVVTFPVHMTVIVSVMLAGWALGLPLKSWYYWVVVPVVVLAGSIPISPQGAGVMEFFAILLTRPQGATVSDAFALTMSIRLVQIVWNLTGGFFVIKGGYHAPTEKEQETLEDETAASSERAPENGLTSEQPPITNQIPMPKSQ